MRIEHVAMWVDDLEKSKDFYVDNFGAIPNDKYHNPSKNFQSYFLSFDDGCRLELMQRPDIASRTRIYSQQHVGLVHLAISVGSKEKVDSLTDRLRSDGYEVVGEPRTTGDGYYESVILDPEGNIIEITI